MHYGAAYRAHVHRVMVYVALAYAVGLLIAPSFFALREMTLPRSYAAVGYASFVCFVVAVFGFVVAARGVSGGARIARIATFAYAACAFVVLCEAVVVSCGGMPSPARLLAACLASFAACAYVYLRPTYGAMNVMTIVITLEVGLGSGHTISSLWVVIAALCVMAYLDWDHISDVRRSTTQGLVGMLTDNAVLLGRAPPKYPLGVVVVAHREGQTFGGVLGIGDVVFPVFGASAALRVLSHDVSVWGVPGNVAVACSMLLAAGIATYVLMMHTGRLGVPRAGLPIICIGLVGAFFATAVPLYGWSVLL